MSGGMAGIRMQVCGDDVFRIKNKEADMKKVCNIMVLVAIILGSLFVCFSVMAAPLPETGTAPRESMFSLIKKGGPVMIPLGLGSILGLALAIERSISLRRDRIIPAGFMETLMAEWRKDWTAKKAIQYCEETDGPVGNIFKAGLLKSHKGEEAVEKAIEDAGLRESDKLKRSLKGLSIIASISPLLGLLGTVYGMITAFQTSCSVGMGKADVLAKGIYEALVTTAAGLTIAIPVLLFYQYMSHKIDAIVDDLDEMGIEFMAHCTDDVLRKGE